MVYRWCPVADVDKTEKITLNLGVVDLGEIDLLVREGFYANRTDFIRMAIRAQLATRATVVEQTVVRKTLVLGTQRYNRRDLEEIPADARDQLQLVWIENADQALATALSALPLAQAA